MGPNNHNFTNRTIETAFIKKGNGFYGCMQSLTRLLKIRSSRGYGSRKSAYSYYIHNN